MNTGIYESLKYSNVDGVEVLSEIIYLGFCNKESELPELAHSIQKKSNNKIKISYIGKIYLITGSYKTIFYKRKKQL